MATIPPIKMETEGASIIKPDPESMQQPMDEDDDFEDTGELEMPSQPQNVWLLRVPRVLHEAWNNMNADEEIQVGSIRRSKKTGKFSMRLRPELHAKVERDYQVNLLDAKTKNTYIFSEKDLPGYKKGGKNNHNNNEPNRGGIDKNRRLQRRAIPKQTRLAHVVTAESNCTPVENDETRQIRSQRLKAEQAKEEATRVQVMDDGYAPEVQSLMNMSRNRQGMAGTRRGKASKPKPQENKAARLPKTVLLDKLFSCFKVWQYWSLKNLKDKLEQPEAYLKEVLNDIAELVRAGTFNGLYKLKDEARPDNWDFAKAEAAPEQSHGDDMDGGSGEDDDELVNFDDMEDDPT